MNTRSSESFLIALSSKLFSITSILILPLFSAIAEPCQYASLRSEFPLTNDRLSFIGAPTSLLKADELCIGTSLSGTSTFLVQDLYRVDSEQWALEPGFRWGADEDLTLELNLNIAHRSQGFLDSVINQWHDTFNLPEGERKEFPNDELVIEGLREDGEFFSFQEEGTFFGNPFLNFLTKGPDFFGTPSALRFGASLPLSTLSSSPKSPDLGVSYITEFPGRTLKGNMSVSFIYYNDILVGNLPYKRLHGETFVRGIYALTNQLDLELSLNFETSHYKSTTDVPKIIGYLDTILRFSKNSKSYFLLLRENPGPNDMTSDVTIALGFSQLFNQRS